MNKILFLLCFCLLLCGCGKTGTDSVEGTEPSTNPYATYIQKNNRTVRVKNFDEYQYIYSQYNVIDIRE